MELPRFSLPPNPSAHRTLKVVALGGGHGLGASLAALRHITDSLTAIVTVADDGGSSGRLRAEMDVIPPGDLRQALSALCDDAAWGQLWRDVLQHRYDSSGPLNGHATGNLLIVALFQLLDDPVSALDLIARLLGARGRVLPMALVPMHIEASATTAHGDTVTVHGQHRVAVTEHDIGHVRLLPEGAAATPQAIEALEAADWVVMGPGSWYTSVMPHLLLPDLRHALLNSSARRCLVMNLGAKDSETQGLSVADHLAVIREHAPDMRVDVVIADPAAVDDIDRLTDEAMRLGASVILRQVAMVRDRDRHDPLRLAAAFRDMIDRVC